MVGASPALLGASACTVVSAGVIGFQAAPIAGAPWGVPTKAGQQKGPLPTSGRTIAGSCISP